MSLQDNLFAEDVEDDVIAFARNETRKSDWDPKANAPERRTSPAARQFDANQEMGVESQRSSSTSPEHAQLQRQAKSTPAIEIYRPPAARRASNCSRVSGMQAIADSSSVKNARQRRPDRAVYVPRHRRSLETEEKTRNLKATYANPHETLNEDPNTNNNSKLQDACCIQQSIDDSSSGNKILEGNIEIEDSQFLPEALKNVVSSDSGDISGRETYDNIVHRLSEEPEEVVHQFLPEALKNVVSSDPREVSDRETRDDIVYKLLEEPEENVPILSEQKESVAISTFSENLTNFNLLDLPDQVEINNKQVETPRSTIEDNQLLAEHLSNNDIINYENSRLVEQSVAESVTSDVLIISDVARKKLRHSKQVPEILTSPEKKVKKIERHKSKPAPPPSPPLKINRDESDWDSLFDDNGDCLDPTLIEELTSAVGEVMIEQPKNNYKAYSKQVEVSSDEFAHVVEIYNFPSEFKTSDLAAVFSSFRNGGFELKWVDDTHCLGVFSSPLVAAEVLASNHPFVKTRPLSEASALSKTKARRSAEFLQPYRNRPETCAALARRLVTGALGVKLATARQEREHEKNVLREAKEKRRLANKQREDVWEGIIPEK